MDNPMGGPWEINIFRIMQQLIIVVGLGRTHSQNNKIRGEHCPILANHFISIRDPLYIYGLGVNDLERNGQFLRLFAVVRGTAGHVITIKLTGSVSVFSLSLPFYIFSTFSALLFYPFHKMFWLMDMNAHELRLCIQQVPGLFSTKCQSVAQLFIFLNYGDLCFFGVFRSGDL